MALNYWMYWTAFFGKIAFIVDCMSNKKLSYMRTHKKHFYFNLGTWFQWIAKLQREEKAHYVASKKTPIFSVVKNFLEDTPHRYILDYATSYFSSLLKLY